MRKIRKERIAIATLSVTAVCHVWLLLMSFWSAQVAGLAFVVEYRVLICLSFAASATGFFLERLRAYAPVYVVRCFAVIAAVRILSASAPLAELLLILPLLIESALYLGVRRAIAVNAVQIAAVAASDASVLQTGGRDAVLGHVLPVALVSVVVSGCAILVVYYRERHVVSEARVEKLEVAVANLSTANLAFQQYAGNVGAESAALERQRITRELHDTVGYALTSVIMSMNAAQVLHRENQMELPELIENTRALAEAALDETRSILYRLRSIRESSPRGLRAVTHLVSGFTGATGARIELNYGNLPNSLGAALDMAIYRLIQEGLTNAFRHGKADNIRVNLWQTRSELLVTVWDDGRGIPGEASEVDEGIGMKGMRERFAPFGAAITARNVAGGFELSAVIPRSIR